MTYIKSNIFLTQLILQFILTGLFSLFYIDQRLQAVFCGILLCVIGIPHGSNDYLYRPDQSVLGMFKFLAIYIGTMAVYAMLWWFMPLFALALFFIISFHHFGQSNFENESWWYLPSWLWGLWILTLPVLLHFNEALAIFQQMIDPNHPIDSLMSYPPSVELIKTWQWVTSICLGLVYMVVIFLYQPQNKLFYYAQFAAVTVWYIVTPLFVGFITVFSLWHSLQSFRHQSEYFQLRYKKGLWSFIKAMLPFSLLALSAFALYIYFWDFKTPEAFILLSLITLPHVLVMHNLYHHSHGQAQNDYTTLS